MMFALTVTSLLTRDKWTQQPFERHSPADDEENVSLTIWYNLNGEKKPWDVQVSYREL